ncbi:hypothetical protein NDU88_010445 [Pleurodeles waltl]|uniref:TIL domain-containing protein n=1 Tax=Pleurodeles waltl TaxID=8319 RepID=A0AAV7PXY4_PLEWA|nr:hypothetical protein NDU88_010445 [Pleurodeles waltl]
MKPYICLLLLPILFLPLLYADQIPYEKTTSAPSTANVTAIDTVCPAGSNYSCNVTCVKYCDNIADATLKCNDTCRCACPEDYVFHSDTNLVCVRISACQTKCEPNMHFEQCAPDIPASCGTPTPDIEGCNPKCVCDDGFILSSNEPRICVSKSECFGRAD